ncbi:hypothetical protein CLAFUW4_00362 [Fulvia fulva]|uniref:Uncharacterized protein n=1 Tax=Passalora fulva TaxID=5499 RepID=A0A9Q8L7J0_PASFU|nr:uncharacterized protein CLAFUR5_00362 [Fulvia fulva]KAK4634654.1 hypothetical protein CLAFUR4_00362 [Fulvia fulva]KAK4637558.1 hypothetical protein CLAFUR0_00362 [Fulvia fulva]UJO12292.1 hypothetical protein CLAFUR5_00362 [Fulvia fulva]WPV10236.1 hypothetical protein CLAFUW4_00362 [Fulvia fulva]WPV23057.1 hypothetical protein CLAFUW7_00366 [Fulvia fulva]
MLGELAATNMPTLSSLQSFTDRRIVPLVDDEMQTPEEIWTRQIEPDRTTARYHDLLRGRPPPKFPAIHGADEYDLGRNLRAKG